MKRLIRRHARSALLESSLAFRKRNTDRPAPDFVIVGAQRCGTTSLFRALAKHPAMMPNVLGAKGVHYFDTSYHQSEAWYLAHFASQAERNKRAEEIGQRCIVGEASPYYLFHPAGAERMAKTIPNTKLIVLLRDPVKRAISHHQHMVWEGHETEADIDAALDLESTRLAGIEEKLLANPALVSRTHQHHSYVARGHYAIQLERLFHYFDRKNIFIMSTEQMVREPASLKTIQSFIGFEPDESIALEKKNASDKFEPRQETVDRLSEIYAESNQQLSELIDVEIPWYSK